MVKRPLCYVALVVALATACSSSSAKRSVVDPAVNRAIALAAETNGDITAGITNSPSDKIGCAAQLLGRDRAHPAVYYAWVFCVGPPNQGNVSVPARATMNGLQVVSLEAPSDANYAGDLARLFPTSLQDRIVQERGIQIDALVRDARRAQSQP